MKIAIVITGIVEEYFLDRMIAQYDNCDYAKIVSTWHNTNKNIITRLIQNGFIVVLSDFPENYFKCSANYQHYSTAMGINHCENAPKNYTHILRVRADMICSDINELLKIYETMYQENKMIFVMKFFVGYEKCSYLIDYAYFGSLNQTKKYANSIQMRNDSRFPEQFAQEEYFGTSDCETINKQVIYSHAHLIEAGIDFSFLKKEYISNTNLIKTYSQITTKCNKCASCLRR